MKKRTSLSDYIFAALLIMGMILLAGCGTGSSPGEAGKSKPASCFDIKNFTVLHVEQFGGDKDVCRIELSPPPGYEFVDKSGNRLSYHPYVLVKPN